MKYYVDSKSFKGGDGSKEHPYRKIQDAANIAVPGDEVIVAPGIYRENVNPINSGTVDNRIIYRAEEKKAAIITGAEEVKNWELHEGNVWKAQIPNALFGDYNPYTTLVYGDWYVATIIAHTGEVFLNNKSMYEVTELDKVLNPGKNMCSWDSDFTVYTWYTTQDTEKNETILYANFQDKNPNEENVEISVRKNCFYPKEEGIGYITFSGFTVRQAATQWAPPTALQEGMIGPHWSKGWTIEDCEVYEAKCSGISLGKYLQKENDNKWSKLKFKDGTQTERENICQAQREGWSKDKIGSHIVRRCDIHDCGQTGIVGHLGGVFSIIEDNEIHHINNKQNLAGAEIGGIKMHAAIDVIIRRNHIHHCTRGLWLDWQAQGTRVSKNLFHDNCTPKNENFADVGIMGVGEDLFIEVSHGPTLIDNNIILSDRALKLPTQGVAFVHNLIAGSMVAIGRGVNNGAMTKISPRYTPYHVPHQTMIAGFMSFLHGDMRFYNNIFIQQKIRMELQKYVDSMGENDWDDNNLFTGTFPYENYPTWEEYEKQFEGDCGMGSAPSDRYYNPLPVWAEGNVYFNGAKPMSKENAVIDNEHTITVSVEERNGKYSIKTNLGDYVQKLKATTLISTETLGMAFEPEQKYENPDGTSIVFNEDYFGNSCGLYPIAGPFAEKFFTTK
ncbi:MAG: hypothetical protein K0R00_2579 [Herbinix sp.]|jgi:hypothetical protein|nr:hypothetical protein [Herbinix sp.]